MNQAPYQALDAWIDAHFDDEAGTVLDVAKDSGAAVVWR